MEIILLNILIILLIGVLLGYVVGYLYDLYLKIKIRHRIYDEIRKESAIWLDADIHTPLSLPGMMFLIEDKCGSYDLAYYIDTNTSGKEGKWCKYRSTEEIKYVARWLNLRDII